MKSKDLGIVGGEDDVEIEAEIRKQLKGGYMYFYMIECQRMKEGGEHIDSSKMDSEEYKEWKKAHEKKEVSTRCSIKRVNSLIKHLKEKGQLNVLGEIGFRSLVGVRDRPIRRELCRSLMEQFDFEQCIVKYGDFLFPLGILCATIVLGEGNEGKSVVEVSKSKNWKALASKYGLKQKVTYAELEEEIKSGSYGRDELKARVLLYLVGIFLCPTGQPEIPQRVHSNLIVPAYERTRVARICAWGKEEVVRVMAKLKLDRPRKQERVISKEVVESEEKEEEMVVLGDDGGSGRKIDGVVKEVEVLRGEVVKKVEVLRGEAVKEVEVLRGEAVKEVEVLRGELKMVTGEIIDGVVKEVVELRSELTGVEKADILSGIDDLEAAICDYLWNSGLESRYSVISMGNQIASVFDVATLKPTKWVGGVTVCYDSKKSLRRIGYLPYHLAQHALDANNKVRVANIATFWGPILGNYVKFTDCAKIMITINYNNSHWYMLVLDMVDRVATIYDSLFTSEAAKQRVNDAKRLHKMNEQVNGYECGMYVMMRMESIGSTGATGDFVVGQWDRS
ncbi:hypothetical protein F3Y22_tig00110210pilonHSYRG00039 [Hibiscus syriacus]|uniref:Ubiquitin-like protease family profile domain-containing protein n=1 Tax=Hibiscus syriacus TaxID=106335 RepID=A0A6A3BCF5_HIBSY|nr:hypothetical protein F3Y22_tig00110210pilonHSYRG00039 [Hibiscus syriacus]